MDDLVWILPSGILICISSVCVIVYIRRAHRQLELAQLEPVMFPHPHPRPPLPPSRISSLTNLVEMVVDVEENDPD